MSLYFHNKQVRSIVRTGEIPAGRGGPVPQAGSPLQGRGITYIYIYIYVLGHVGPPARPRPPATGPPAPSSPGGAPHSQAPGPKGGGLGWGFTVH